MPHPLPRSLSLVIILAFSSALSPQILWGAQSSDPANVGQNGQSSKKHILWIIPNNRTSPTLKNYQPLTSAQKFRLATSDSLDRGSFILAALFAGQSQLSGSNPSFGDGTKGYALSFVASTADLTIGNFMTEAIFPTVLHQDPRYFRRGTGSGWSRLGYAAGQIFLTHGDSGRTEFNFSEIFGNSTAVAISNAYYPDNRDAADAAMRLATQVGVDMAGNILKEFWPDIVRKFLTKKRQPSTHG